MLKKVILFSIGCLFAFNTQADVVTEVAQEKANQYSRELLDIVMNVVKNCYKGPDKTDGNQLVKCVGEVFKTDVPNPLHYKIRLSGNCPGDVDLVLYNSNGDMIACYLTLGQGVQVNRCISYKVPALSNGEDMAVFPPTVLIK